MELGWGRGGGGFAQGLDKGLWFGEGGGGGGAGFGVQVVSGLGLLGWGARVLDLEYEPS